jgi:single-strand selective monofunctional uracil DNA glycosylase
MTPPAPLAKTFDRLNAALELDAFLGGDIAHVYNPLDYARGVFDAYLARYGTGPREAVLLGMNPGPFGMVQTGVPFGDVAMVRDWLGLPDKVRTPAREHPKRPIHGFGCERGEVSGTRLWGWARDRFGAPERFFERFIVLNYCPLAFLAASGRNCTPDKLPAAAREPLFAACDEAVRACLAYYRPAVAVGIGAFAEGRLRDVCGEDGPRVGRVLHPSPASPQANRGWAEAAERQLAALGVSLD